MDEFDLAMAKDALSKGRTPEPVRMEDSVRRDASLPASPAPDRAQQQLMLDALEQDGVCLPSARFLPKGDKLDQYPLPLGLLVSPLGADKKFLQLRDMAPVCKDCGACITGFGQLNTACQWICVFCDADNEAPERYGQIDVNWDEFPELQSAAAVEWDEGPSDAVLLDSTDTVVVAVDLTLARTELAGVTAALLEALRVVGLGGGDPRIGLVGFDNAVQLMRLDAGSVSGALCVPGTRRLSAS